MRLSSALTGCALATAVLINTSTSALAAPAGPEPIQFVPFDQATIFDPADLTPASGGLLLTADGTNVCATNPESIALPDGTYPCFSDYGSSPAIPGAPYPVDPPRLVPFDQATVVDPSTVTIVPGGLITADGVDVCAENPGSIVFPDGRYPCYINFVQTYAYHPTPEEGIYDTPPATPPAIPPATPPAGPSQAVPGQVRQMPVGGADTGVPATTSGATSTGVVAGVGLLGMTVMSAGAVLALQARRRS
jgi:hypothetical protein